MVNVEAVTSPDRTSDGLPSVKELRDHIAEYLTTALVNGESSKLVALHLERSLRRDPLGELTEEDRELIDLCHNPAFRTRARSNNGTLSQE